MANAAHDTSRDSSAKSVTTTSSVTVSSTAQLNCRSLLVSRASPADPGADFVLYGHTHYQLVRRLGPVLVINPGSAGEARDTSNDLQLSCAVLDTVTEEFVVTDFADESREVS